MKLTTLARKYLVQYPRWGFDPPKVRLSPNVQSIGTEYGGYFPDTSRIEQSSVVYSLGIGEDISFDLGMIERFGVTVHAFDPTPKVKAWLAEHHLPKNFRHHEIGIAEFDGDAVFYLPPRRDYVSHSVVKDKRYSSDSIKVPVARLTSVMQKLNHSRIDVLKMDIEGAEYSVIDHIAKEKICVDQILVEFHHRLSSIGIGKTKRAIDCLEQLGMEVANICPRMEVFTFLRKR